MSERVNEQHRKSLFAQTFDDDLFAVLAATSDHGFGTNTGGESAKSVPRFPVPPHTQPNPAVKPDDDNNLNIVTMGNTLTIENMSWQQLSKHFQQLSKLHVPCFSGPRFVRRALNKSNLAPVSVSVAANFPIHSRKILDTVQ